MLNKLFKRKPKFVTWTNRDGAPGGQVSRFASVHPDAIVEEFGVVLSGSDLGPSAHVKPGDIVDGDHVIRLAPTLPNLVFRKRNPQLKS